MKLYELVYEQQKYIYLCSKNVRLLLDAIDTEQNLDPPLISFVIRRTNKQPKQF